MLSQPASPSTARVTDLSAPRRAEPPVQTAVYDGPLELLLFLVRREGVDVRQIPVARICDAYLAFLAESDVLDVDKAGDYLLMAATLCQLKARELLPRDPRSDEKEEDELDPSEALARRLLEYERYRDAAEQLGARERLERDVFVRPAVPTSPDEQPIDPVTDSFGLLKTFYALLERASRPPPVHEIHRESFSLVETCRGVLRALQGRVDALLTDLFVSAHTRPRRIFTFLSTLELARHQFLDIAQSTHLGPIRLTSRVNAEEADLRVISAQEEEEARARVDADG